MHSMSEIEKAVQHKEFQKLKRYVTKRFPGAHTVVITNAGKTQFKVIDGQGYCVVGQELMIPPADTVSKAWEYAKYAGWFSNMIRKSNNAFSEEKMMKKLANKNGDF